MTEGAHWDDSHRQRFWRRNRVLMIRDRCARMLGLDAPSKVEATLKVELIVRALEDTLSE
jgi:hypothetical protein